MVKYRPATMDDMVEVAAKLRQPDRDELRAATGDAPLEALISARTMSRGDTVVGYDDGGIWCIFGHIPLGGLLGRTAAPWMLGTPRIALHKSALIRDSIRYLAAVRETYPTLVNFVDARNTRSIRYLKAIGFTLDDAAPFGVAGLPFHRFHQGLENV